VNIPYIEFTSTIQAVAGRLVTMPTMQPAPMVHVFDLDWLRNDFVPVWTRIKWEYKTQQNEPLENNVRRRTCDEIAKRCLSYLIESARKTNGDADIGAGGLEANVMLPAGYELNRVSGPGGHRTLLLAVTEDHKAWFPLCFEQQLTTQNYVDTPFETAVGAGVDLWDVFL
jgi:hypothetical protein